MAKKQYKKFGLRRDKDFGDLSSPSQALNNLLDSLTGLGDLDQPETFISVDLDPIQNLFSTGIEASDYQQVAGTAIQTTDESGQLELRKPRATFQNRLDTARTYTGEPRLNGGDGLTASYFDKEQIDINHENVFCTGCVKVDLSSPGRGYRAGNILSLDRTGKYAGSKDIKLKIIEVSGNGGILDFIQTDGFDNDPTRTVGSHDVTADGGTASTAAVFTVVVGDGGSFTNDTVWEAGNFDWFGKITPQAADIDGGVQWEGYFIPTDTGTHVFNVSSKQCTTFDFMTDGYTSGISTYTEYKRIGISSTFAASQYLSDANKIQITSYSYNDHGKHIGVGQSVTDSTSKWENDGTYIRKNTTIEEFDPVSGIITLESPDGDAIISNPNGTDITFSKGINQNISYSINLKDSANRSFILQEQEKYRIRLKYYIPPQQDSRFAERTYDLNILYPNAVSSSNLRYNKLYSLDYDFSSSAKGDFIKYLDQSVYFGGGTIGGGTENTQTTDNYVMVKTSKKVDIRYKPPTELSSVLPSTNTKTLTVYQNSNVISCPNTTGVEVGNHVIGLGIPKDTRVKVVIINKSLVIDHKVTDTVSSTPIKFINHRGFVGWGTANYTAHGSNSVDNTLTLQYQGASNDAKRFPLRTGMVVIGNNIPKWSGITTTSSGDSVIVQNGTQIPTLSNEPVYFYEYQGLINDSLFAFCRTNIGGSRQTKCVSVTKDIEAGSTRIYIDNTDDISNGDRVLGFYFNSDGSTTVTSVNTTNGYIDISSPCLFIKKGNNFTIYTDTDSTYTSSTDGDRSLCCPPKDTSPPFAATEIGMETTPSFPNLSIANVTSTPGVVVFEELSGVISDSSKIINSPTTVGSENYQGKIPIMCGNDPNPFKILTTQHPQR